MVYDYKKVIVQEPTVLTIGNFDGVHIGHRNLIETVKACAREKGISSAVLTFTPHPMTYFNKDGFYRITDDSEKKLVLNSMSVDHIIFLNFNEELVNMMPENYVKSVLVRALNCKHIIVGKNHFFGKNKSGNVETLKKICKNYNITVDVADPVYYGDEIASSKRVRQYLSCGDIITANKLLGEPYFINGEIVYGKSLGRTLGFPTINLDVKKDKLLPHNGVYFTRTFFNGSCYNGITNVGVRPTVEGGTKTVETFLFDFDEYIYGETVVLKFLHRRRNEIKYNGLPELKEAILSDKAAAKLYFANGDE